MNFKIIVNDTTDWEFTDDHLFGGVNYNISYGDTSGIKFGTITSAEISFTTDYNLSKGTKLKLYAKDNDESWYTAVVNKNRQCLGIFYITQATKINYDGGARYKIVAYDEVSKYDAIIDDFLSSWAYWGDTTHRPDPTSGTPYPAGYVKWSYKEVVQAALAYVGLATVDTGHYDSHGVWTTYLTGTEVSNIYAKTIATVKPAGNNISLRQFISWVQQAQSGVGFVYTSSSKDWDVLLSLESYNFMTTYTHIYQDQIKGRSVSTYTVLPYDIVNVSSMVGVNGYTATATGATGSKTYTIDYNPLFAGDSTNAQALAQICIDQAHHNSSTVFEYTPATYKTFTAGSSTYVGLNPYSHPRVIIHNADGTTTDMPLTSVSISASGCTYTLAGSETESTTVGDSYSGSIAQLEETKQDKFTDDELSDLIKWASGATITEQHTTVKSGWVNVSLYLTYSTSVASGGNVFTGSIDSTYAPKYDQMGCSYYSDNCLIMRFEPTGDITVRNASSSSVAISGGAHLSITYPYNE